MVGAYPWWVKPGPGADVGLPVGRTGSWQMATGPRGPRASIVPLVGGAGF